MSIRMHFGPQWRPRWQNEGIPLPTLQEQLGHAHLMTSFLYVKKVAPELALAPIAGRTGWTDAA